MAAAILLEDGNLFASSGIPNANLPIAAESDPLTVGRVDGCFEFPFRSPTCVPQPQQFDAALLGGTGRTDPLNHAHRIGGLRVVCLDSTVPGLDSGSVAPDSLSWLADQLGEPAPEGTILAMHHAPLPVVQDLAASWELVGQPELAGVLAGSDVRAILAGHFHQAGFGLFAGIGVHAATSLCYTQDLSTGRGMRGQDGAQAWQLISVHAATVTSTVAPIGRYPTVVAPHRAADAPAELAARGVRFPTA